MTTTEHVGYIQVATTTSLLGDPVVRYYAACLGCKRISIQWGDPQRAAEDAWRHSLAKDLPGITHVVTLMPKFNGEDRPFTFYTRCRCGLYLSDEYPYAEEAWDAGRLHVSEASG